MSRTIDGVILHKLEDRRDWWAWWDQTERELKGRGLWPYASGRARKPDFPNKQTVEFKVETGLVVVRPKECEPETGLVDLDPDQPDMDADTPWQKLKKSLRVSTTQEAQPTSRESSPAAPPSNIPEAEAETGLVDSKPDEPDMDSDAPRQKKQKTLTAATTQGSQPTSTESSPLVAPLIIPEAEAETGLVDSKPDGPDMDSDAPRQKNKENLTVATTQGSQPTSTESSPAAPPLNIPVEERIASMDSQLAKIEEAWTKRYDDWVKRHTADQYFRQYLYATIGQDQWTLIKHKIEIHDMLMILRDQYAPVDGEVEVAFMERANALERSSTRLVPRVASWIDLETQMKQQAIPNDYLAERFIRSVQRHDKEMGEYLRQARDEKPGDDISVAFLAKLHTHKRMRDQVSKDISSLSPQEQGEMAGKRKQPDS